MKSGTITKTNKKQDSRRYTSGINEALLRSEICFWQDMIAGCDPTHPLESLERMQQALTLAKSRLLTLLIDYPHEYASDILKNRPSNVHSILSRSESRARNSN